MKNLLLTAAALALLGAGCGASQATKSAPRAVKEPQKTSTKKEKPTFSNAACEQVWLDLNQPKLATDVAPPADFPPPPTSLLPCFNVKWVGSDSGGQIFITATPPEILSAETFLTPAFNDGLLNYYETEFQKREFTVERIGLKGKLGANKITVGKNGIWGNIYIVNNLNHPENTFVKVIFPNRQGLAGLNRDCSKVAAKPGPPPASVIGFDLPPFPPLPPETEYCGYVDMTPLDLDFVKMKFHSALIRPEIIKYYLTAFPAQGFTVSEGTDFGFPILNLSKGEADGELIPYTTEEYEILVKVKR